MTVDTNSSLTGCAAEYALGGNYYIGIAVVYILTILILFIAIAIVCDDYFVPSLEVICQRLNLSEDVAGATFMAAGSSAPELFTSLAAVTNSSNIGVGTIVGSAVFNILIIISLSAILSKNVLLLDWRPLTRDAFFYGVSIVMFSAFAWDGLFEWWESLVTLLYYFLYIAAMKFNPRLFRLLDAISRGCSSCCYTKKPAEVKSPDDCENTKEHVVSENSLGPVVQITPPTDNNNMSAVSVTYTPLPECSEEKYCNMGLGVPTQMMRTISSGSSGIGSMTDDLPSHTEPDDKHWLPKSESLDSVCIDEEATKQNGRDDHYFTKATPDHEDTRPPVDIMIRPADPVTPFDVTSVDLKSPSRARSETLSSHTVDEYDEVQVCCCEACPKVMTQLPRKRQGCCSWFRYFLSIGYFMIAFPFQLLFSFTIPNSMKPHLKKYYIVSFVGSVVWIAILSYTMVIIVERFGCLVGFNDYVMGLVVVAAGTSVPDALSSVIVAREGHGDMAVSNALGSNVFDINLGLGLPFLIKTIYQNGPLVLLSELSEDVFFMPHAKFGFILLLILVVVYLLICFNKFKLTRSVGLFLILFYVLFIAYALVQELVCDSGTFC